MLRFKPAFSLTSSFTSFSSSSLSAIRVVLSTYLRLLIFLSAILISVCDSFSPVGMMFSAYKLDKHGDGIQRCTPLTVLNQSVVPCLVLTASQLFVLLLEPHTGFSGDRQGGLVGIPF